VLVLAAYLVGGLAVSTLAARRQRIWTPSRLRPELVL
jgi:putative membrane protein